jgi:hypothetical protein
MEWIKGVLFVRPNNTGSFHQSSTDFTILNLLDQQMNDAHFVSRCRRCRVSRYLHDWVVVANQLQLGISQCINRNVHLF